MLGDTRIRLNFDCRSRRFDRSPQNVTLDPGLAARIVGGHRKLEKTYKSDDLNIAHAEFLRLKQNGQISLGVDRKVAERVCTTAELMPRKHAAGPASIFWGLAAWGAFLYPVYLSFTDAWWWFIVGFIAARVILKASLHANQVNVLDAASVDEEFYERMAGAGAWFYRMDENDASRYRIR